MARPSPGEKNMNNKRGRKAHKEPDAPQDPQRRRQKTEGQAGGAGSAVQVFVSTTPVSLGGADMLQQLLGPLPVSQFKQEYFGRKPVHVKGNATRFSRINRAMNDLDVMELLQDTASDSISAWVVRPDEEGRIDTVRLQDPAAAYTMYMANHSTYCRAPERIEKALVNGCIQGLKLGFARSPWVKQAIEGEVELFCTRAGHTTGVHFDFQENVTLQLAGRKRWRMIKSAVAHPVRGCAPHYKKQDEGVEPSSGLIDGVVEEQLKVHRLTDNSFTFGPKQEDQADIMEVVLEAGDVLYHPAGIWHSVSADADSISINISLHGNMWADHLASGFRQLLIRDPAFRILVGGQCVHNEEYLRDLLARVRDDVMPQLTVSALLPECLTAEAAMEEVEEQQEEEEEEEEEGEEEEGEEEEGGKGHERSCGGCVEDEYSEEEEDDGDEDEEPSVVEVASFPLPYQEGHALRLNPLATAFGLEESRAVKEEGGGLWVVNLVYGDSDLTSTARVVLRVPDELQEAMAFITRSAISFKAHEVTGSSSSRRDKEEVGKLLGALLYFGVLNRVWDPARGSLRATK